MDHHPSRRGQHARLGTWRHHGRVSTSFAPFSTAFWPQRSAQPLVGRWRAAAGHPRVGRGRRRAWPRGPRSKAPGHAASEVSTRLSGPPPRRRAPWHGAVTRGEACGFLLSPIWGITSPTDFSHSYTVCCTPYRRREGGR
jgi:hypothetical protein